jgi:hypothetical protein
MTAATVVQGNFIGTDAAGNNALGNLVGGIYFYGSGSNTIGGAVAGAGNLISGNFQEGVSVGDPGANYNVIQGNFIGTKSDGISPLGNALHNIDFLDTASNNLVGGTVPGADNRIAFVKSSLYDGVRVRAGCLGNFVSRNGIFSNGSLGIVIGANPGLNLSNVVILTQVASDSAGTSIAGTFSSYPNGPFHIQFYKNVAPNPSGYGEGLTYIGSTNITTGANGKTSFALTLPTVAPPGSYVCATATDSANTTWEFGADVQVQALSPPPPSAPSLSFAILPASGNVPARILYAWSNGVANLIVEQTTNLTPAVIWSLCTNSVTTNGTTNSITVNPTGRVMFYRLAPASSLPPPAANLSIALLAASNSVPAMIGISWPSSLTNLVLQQTTNLTPPVLWSLCTNTVTANGASNSITANLTGMATFYRLQGP